MITISTLLFVPANAMWMIHSCLTQKYTYFHNLFHSNMCSVWNASAQTCGTSRHGCWQHNKQISIWKQHNAFPLALCTVDYSKSSDTCSESEGEAENESQAFPGSAHTHWGFFLFSGFESESWKGWRVGCFLDFIMSLLTASLGFWVEPKSNNCLRAEIENMHQNRIWLRRLLTKCREK